MQCRPRRHRSGRSCLRRHPRQHYSTHHSTDKVRVELPAVEPHIAVATIGMSDSPIVGSGFSGNEAGTTGLAVIFSATMMYCNLLRFKQRRFATIRSQTVTIQVSDRATKKSLPYKRLTNNGCCNLRSKLGCLLKTRATSSPLGRWCTCALHMLSASA